MATYSTYEYNQLIVSPDWLPTIDVNSDYPFESWIKSSDTYGVSSGGDEYDTTWVFHGENLQYDAGGKLIGGTFTSYERVYEEYFGDTTVEESLTGFSISAKLVADAEASSSTADNQQVLELIFGSNDTFTGGRYDDVISGFNGNDVAYGNAGADSIFGGAGHDKLDGGAGDDTLDGGFGNDQLIGGVGYDLLYGGGGRDTLVGGSGADILDGGAAADRLDGGTGTDTVTYFKAAGAVIASLSSMTGSLGEAAGDIYVSIENLTGSKFNDKIYGNEDDNVLSGSDGNDAISAGMGEDKLSGGNGNDILIGGDGYDTLTGGAGNDQLRGGDRNDILTGGAGRDRFVFDTDPASGGTDTITDFNVKDDRIVLDADMFSQLTDGKTLSADEFHIGPRAADWNDLIIYNDKTGNLYYDWNGNFEGGLLRIAKLSAGLDLVASDFLLI